MIKRYQASAPGSLMLMGEHAILWGSKCLVTAVDQRLTVVLEPHNTDIITIKSALFGEETVALTELIHFNDSQLARYQHRFVIAVLIFYRTKLTYGFNLNIVSQIHDKKGFGSSAAVVAATQAVVQKFCGFELSVINKIHDARTIIRWVQKHGSGADVTAAICGGISTYRMDPLEIQSIKCTLPLTIIFCGHKTPTPTVIEHVQKHMDNNAGLQDSLLIKAAVCMKQALKALISYDMLSLGKAFEHYADLMIAMNVEDDECRQALKFLRQQPGIKGAKISGSGLGDCVIGCGIPEKSMKLPASLTAKNMEIINIQLTDQGVRDESS